jgi:hypothetical protein
MLTWFSNLGAELRRIMAVICDRPAHRERWAILLGGIALHMSVGGMIGLLVWFGMSPFVNASLVIPWFGWIAIGFLGLLGLVIIALLGIVRHIQVGLPNGTQIGLDIADKYDVGQQSTGAPDEPPI